LRKYGFVEVEYFPENDVFDDCVFVAQASSEGALFAPLALTNKAHQQDIAKIARKSEEQLEKAILSKSTHPRPELSQSYVAPRNTVEQTMADTWQEFFNIEPVGIHDDFFELGGDSLLAVQLISKLRKRFQTDISSQSLWKSPTIAELAKSTLSNTHLESAIPSLLVEIKSGHTERTPLFLIPPGGGTPYAYRDLANCLAPEQPVYGIQTPGLDGKTQPLTQFEEMANHYIKALRVVQPTGPYCFGGASFGGMVAFEMAQQFYALGEKIALLVMIDVPCPTNFSIEANNYIKTQAYSAGLTLNPSLPVSSEYFNQLGLDEQAHYLFEHSEIVNTTEPESVISHVRNVLQVIQANEQALKNYVPRTYPDRILFCRVSDLELVVMPPHPEKSWSELIMGGIDFHEIPGNHFTMLSHPHVEVMAKLLTAYIGKI
jgi:thioesterase domain-containing protein/acyl carrier protein